MLTKSQIKSRIATVSRQDQRLRDSIQTVLVNIAGHAFEHGDVTMYDMLMGAMRGANRKVVVKWIADNGFARLDASTGTFKLNKAARRNADFADGSACVEYLETEGPKWFDDVETAQQIAKALDVAKRIESVANSVENAIKDGKAVELNEIAIHKALRHLQDTLTQINNARNEANGGVAKTAKAV